MATCKSCGAEVWWKLTKNDKRMPVDPVPSDQGNVQLVGDLAIVLTAEQLEQNTGPLHRSHFATCPEAKSHRRG